MSRLRLPLVALAIAALFAACVRTSRLTQAQPRDQLYASLIGTWHGTLEYKDYQDSTRRVTLPTQLQIVPAPDEDGLELRYTYDDGPGKTVRSVDHLHFDRAMQQARWGGVKDSTLQRFVVQGRTGGGNGEPVRLVLETDGRDDDQPARIRETFVVSAGAVHLLKETAINGQTMAFRHQYQLRRAQ
ncbi:MAG: hypothetical protein K2R93_01785 [Gemmatimonadaceae bacterium]|nr:hypothetical protein [Gemmatimonadaceae bacterium]